MGQQRKIVEYEFKPNKKFTTRIYCETVNKASFCFENVLLKRLKFFFSFSFVS